VNKTTDVHLTYYEVWLAASVGVSRQLQNIRVQRTGRYGADNDTTSAWQHHIEGCLGELATAKAYGLYWSGSVGDLRAADAGPLQVRATRYRNGRLIVHPAPADSPDHAFVLVVGTPLRLTLAGWVWGHEAQRDEHWGELQRGRPAFNVPQDALRPMHTLQISGTARADMGPRSAANA